MMKNIKIDKKMEVKNEILQDVENIERLKELLKSAAQVEELFRIEFAKDDSEWAVNQKVKSKSYQVFLERLVNEVF